MEVLYSPQKKEGLSLALGFFDGIHKGHKEVILDAVKTAQNNKVESAVVSFVEHPTCFLLNRTPNYIISLDEKIEKIKDLGVDYLYLLNFDEKFAAMSKEEYFDFINKMTSPTAITTGFNHFFGKDKQGDTTFLSQICAENNIKYTTIQPIMFEDKVISSSCVRKAILNGDVDLAYKMLGYHFFVQGKVVKGAHLGTKLGFKTINLNYPEKIINLPYGVYCTKVIINDKEYNSVSNWGIKPTVSNKNQAVLETHIFDFDDNLYEKDAKILFLTKIRDEKKFDTPSDLRNQIIKDVEFCKNYYILR